MAVNVMPHSQKYNQLLIIYTYIKRKVMIVTSPITSTGVWCDQMNTRVTVIYVAKLSILLSSRITRKK